ncbi:MAG: CoA ester lyase [Proteobacteria bacterium]|nr:CoA ester lyase [Pseudomonadota bacterium]
MMGAMARSLLFVPGHQPQRFDKACHSGADAVVLDLEDAVPADAKAAARDAVGQWLAGRGPLGANGPLLAVRVNAADTPWHLHDMEMCSTATALQRLMLPKVQHPVVLRAVGAALGGSALLWPLIESARGMHRLDEIAAAPRVERLVFGTIDFQADMGMESHEGDDVDDDGRALLYFRSRMVLASRVAGLQSPVDGVTTAVDDAARVEADARQARRLGFGGKLCIHPRQVACVHQGFMPDAQRITWARRVVEADAASGGAAVALDGRMIDRPVVLKARAVLAAAAAVVPA